MKFFRLFFDTYTKLIKIKSLIPHIRNGATLLVEKDGQRSTIIPVWNGQELK